MENPQGYSDARAADEIVPGVLPKKFTKEELDILNECSRDCMMYRCLPLGVVFMGATNFLVKGGYLKAHPKYGALFKNFAAVFAAYVIGKISYQNTCRQKILTKIPNSHLAKALSGKMNSEVMPTEFAVEESRDDSLQQATPTYDLDTNRSSLETAYGLDDNFRPTIDREVRRSRIDDQPSAEFKSYNDLRYQNRKAHEKPPPENERPVDKMQRRRPEPSPWASTQQTAGKKKNQYGDEWDE